ncbi:hypothetical protein [Phaeobacter gallaeciensis]|uniref:D-galactarate dehydratase n=1 Tax=Phaeobacter gallaeciensis TaxID=60890 RepID=A0AAC9ZBQ2_9RHOB|nr:hypothetical protein [Phaeobacter gallaeciensis]AHD10216.1 hypothetical protein Gal_02471 [Phaeobacter gallaeciensis DSM 26640]ATE93480.1 hypothetical protein PhaeoP11_02462 [Phaeobacter gallaeciensis]ATE96699.1 hypothetical protein PhaeoP73_01385 [Phaeobacter gallaeciensis]ATF02144.1 hypothetical protein PhaeoP75_02511 [Phaeobacter gallaeciensis]ATF06524.1 hypothetical protein PhaeoP63_02460 [Phaeobacter gallaeciensis]
MRYSVLILSSVVLLGACGPLQWNSSVLGGQRSAAPVADPVDDTAGSVPLAPGVEQTPLDGTGGQQVASAGTASGYTGRASTVASLGDPSQSGLWMETPLVDSPQVARVRSPRGTEVTLTLRPIGGDTGAGSRLSIDAMRALGLPLTELVEVQVLPAA